MLWPLSLHWLTASGRGTWEFPEEPIFDKCFDLWLGIGFSKSFGNGRVTITVHTPHLSRPYGSMAAEITFGLAGYV